MKLTPWLVLLSLTLISCSGSKSAKKVSEETPQVELSDADEFIDNDTTEDAQSVAAAEPAEVTDSEVEASDHESDALAGNDAGEANPVLEEPVVEEAAVAVKETTPHSSPAVAGTKMQYTVQKNETLMLIAFKIYGDYDKWKMLATQNRSKLSGHTKLRAGMVLEYTSPAQEFVWNPQGLPYLIRTGDTLGLISKNVYSTPKKWKLLWENNRPLIKDPNRIFAGFTLYYLENGREVANEL